ncbi:MAG: hypothetical protein AB1649_31300, partial [Chloroflexota bacterium]
MKVEIDQSGKIGDTKVPTVLAFSNGENYAILIPATVKRKCVLELRKRGKETDSFYIQLFSVCLYLLLKNHTRQLAQIIVDFEYSGHDHQIRQQVLHLMRRAKITRPRLFISFDRVGKRSPAH